MRKRILIGILLGICLGFIAGFALEPASAGPVKADRGLAIRPLSPAGTEVKGDNWLFIIGINTYIEWPRLRTAVNDAKSLKNVLLSKYYFDDAHLIEIYDDQATRKNIIEKLRYLAMTVKPEDSLVIFYAGHGHIDSITKEGSWIPVESGRTDASSWISNHDIKNYIRIDAIKAKHILLISDSCFSGDFFRGSRGKLPEVNDSLIKKAFGLTSRQAITSGGLEPVSDDGFAENSVFTFFLLKKLRENTKPFLIPSDFFSDIRAGVASNASQFPLIGTLRDTGGSEGGEIVFFLKHERRDENLSEQITLRKAELERLNKLQADAEKFKKHQTEEMAKRENELANLNLKIKEAQKNLGTVSLGKDDTLDEILAMVREKEEQEKKLEQLRREKEEQEALRQKQIIELKMEIDRKTIAMLIPEVQKYEEIVGSKYGQSLKSKAWKSLIAKCPPRWCDNIDEGIPKQLLIPPDIRKKGSRGFGYALYDFHLQGAPRFGGEIEEVKQHESLVFLESPDQKGWVKVSTMSGKTGYVHVTWLAR